MSASRANDIPTVVDVMTPEPIVISQDKPLQEAARILEEREISGLPVVDDGGVLVGVLSETDLVHARATEYLWRRWPGLKVLHLMHSPALTADRSMSVSEAAALMERAHVHRLVVVDEDQRTPIGVISTSDLVRSMVAERHDA